MRLAIVGFGYMGGVHAKSLSAAPGVELSAIVTRDPSKVAAYPDIKVYRELASALDDSSIDAVDICLPTDQHMSATIEALRRGKHVLVEKPMALDYESCLRMIEESHHAGRILMVAQVLRFFPAYDALQKAVEEHSLGTVREAFFRRRCAQPAWSDWITDPTRSGGGAFDLLIHDVDMALHLFGAPSAISSTGVIDHAAGTDTVSSRLFYAGGPVVEITGGWVQKGVFPFSMEFTILGDRGLLDYSSAARPLTRYHVGGAEEPVALDQVDGYAAQIAYFAECRKRGEQPSRCRPEESAEAVRLAHAMLDARSRNGEKISWK